MWEYKVVTDVFDIDELNEIGAEGWELTAVVQGDGSSATYFFKRQKPLKVVGMPLPNPRVRPGYS